MNNNELKNKQIIHIDYSPTDLGRSGHLLKDVISLFIWKELIENSNILYNDFMSKQKIIPVSNIKNKCVNRLDKYDKTITFNFKIWKGLTHKEAYMIINEIKKYNDKTLLIRFEGIIRILLFQIDNWYINNHIKKDIFNTTILPLFNELYYKGDNINFNSEQKNIFSIHIRRGDIFRQTINVGFNFEYYKNIINIINSVLNIPIHIYSENYNNEDIIPLQNMNNVTCIFGNDSTFINDFRELCLSKYVILSNSAMSTTIAYLSKGNVFFENSSVDGFSKTLNVLHNTNRSIKHFKHDKLQNNFFQYNLSNLKEKINDIKIKELIIKFGKK